MSGVQHPASAVGSFAEPLVLRGSGDPVVIPGRLWLAPMEGITDPVFRACVAPLGGVAAAVTEFIRISAHALPAKVIRRYQGETLAHVPVGVQLMAADADHLAATARTAVACGAPWIDLNFGCPAAVVFSKCAGSAMLAKPERMAEVIRTAAQAVSVPVTAKMRCGISDPGHLRDILLAVAEAGVAMITLHARLRVQGYHQPATWSWIADAVRWLRAAGHQVPVIGNGGVDWPQQARELRTTTGCDGVMIGRAALADPWIFHQAHGGAAPDATTAAAFVLDYAARIRGPRGDGICLSKLKQLTRWYRAGGLFDNRDDQRTALLRSDRLDTVLEWYAQRARI